MRRLRYICGLVVISCLALFVSVAVALFAAAPTQGQSAAAATPTEANSIAPTLAPNIDKQRVTFQSDGLTLVGYLYTPASGNGPFPGIIWNHGSEKSPGTSDEFDAIADIFVPAGYVVFDPIRRGHGDSQGTYIDDAYMAERQAHGAAAANQLLVKLMETEQLDDQTNGLNYLKSQPDVDTSRLAVVGCSYGGIQSLLGAAANIGYKAAVAESPGAESWNGNVPLQQALLKAVDSINIPVFLIHPEDDVTTAPGYTLGQEFQKLGKPYGLEIYPALGPANEQGHCFGGAAGFHVWGPDVLNFLSNTL